MAELKSDPAADGSRLRSNGKSQTATAAEGAGVRRAAPFRTDNW